MYKVLICDDDRQDADYIQEIVTAQFANNKIGLDLYQLPDPLKISPQVLSDCDIAFLDIDYQSNEVNGLDVARMIRSLRKDAIIIFVTNFIEYAPSGYEVRAFRYVLKRNLDRDLPSIVEKAIQEYQSRGESIKVLSEDEYVDLRLSSILYIDVTGHNTVLHCIDSKSGKPREHLTHTPLSAFADDLENRGFLRIHKSILVNMQNIKRFQSKGAALSDGTVLRVSEKNYALNKEKYLLWRKW